MSGFVSILEVLNEYRDCCRSLWNRAFRARFEDSQDWSIVDSFSIIKNELFRTIVLTPHEFDDEGFSLGLASPGIKVKLSRKNATTVMINRVKGESAGYWDHPIEKMDSHVSLHFLDFFDWNSYGFLDMNLIMCEIVSHPGNTELEGHKVLVELSCVDVLLDLND